MSFGSATPIEIAVRGGSIGENRDFLKKVQQSMSAISALRDIQVVQALDYPTIDVKIDREKAGLSGATVNQVSRSVLAATSSSRFLVPNYWPDPKSGIGYQVQVEIPQPAMSSLDDLGTVPILHKENGSPLLLRDVAQITQGTMPGQFDRYNMKRELSLTANITGADLGSVSGQVITAVELVKKDDDVAKDASDKAAIEKAAQAAPGQPAPAKAGRITYELRGQIPPLRQMLSGLGVGLLLALLAIFLMLTANYQSFRLSLVTVSAAPSVLAGAGLLLWLSHSTLNIQSFIGVIMGLGVAMANAILVVTFAEQRRREGESSAVAAENAAVARLGCNRRSAG